MLHAMTLTDACITVLFPWSLTRFRPGPSEFLSWTSGPRVIADRGASGFKWKEPWKLWHRHGWQLFPAHGCSYMRVTVSESLLQRCFSKWCHQFKIALLSLQRSLASLYWSAWCHPWSLTPLDLSGWTCVINVWNVTYMEDKCNFKTNHREYLNGWGIFPRSKVHALNGQHFSWWMVLRQLQTQEPSF